MPSSEEDKKELNEVVAMFLGWSYENGKWIDSTGEGQDLPDYIDLIQMYEKRRLSK